MNKFCTCRKALFLSISQESEMDFCGRGLRHNAESENSAHKYFVGTSDVHGCLILLNQTKFNCNYASPIDLSTNEIQFGDKLIGKV